MVSWFQVDPALPRPTIPFPPQPDLCLYFYPKSKIISHNYADNLVKESPHHMIVGPQLSRVDLTMGYDMLVILVAFQPGGLHRLLRLPMHEIQDTPLDASLLLGREICDITEQLNAENDPDKMIEIVQQYLLKKLANLKSMLPMEEVLMKILQEKRVMNVDQLAKEACVSIRQLERQFNERAGMPPKLFFRLVRFSKAWIMREKRPDLSWLKIAHGCDYSDQMHMIRDFKEFAGVTPHILQNDLEKTPFRLQGSSFFNGE